MTNDNALTPEILDGIKRGVADIKAGRTRSWSEARETLGLANSNVGLTTGTDLREFDALIDECIALLEKAKHDGHTDGPRHYYSFQALTMEGRGDLSASIPEGPAADLAVMFCTMKDLCDVYNIPLAKALDDVAFYHKYKPRIVT